MSMTFLAGAAVGTVLREQTFSIGQGLLWLLEGVLSQKGLGRLQDRVNKWPAGLDIFHECLQVDRKERMRPKKTVYELESGFLQ